MLEKDTQQQQQRRRSELVRAAREKSATARCYRAGYCDNTRCDVRAVLVMAKNHLESIGELHCPSCGRRLLLSAHSFGVRGEETAEQYDAIKNQRARDYVANQIVNERLRREQGDSLVILKRVSDIKSGVTLDELQAMFRERDQRDTHA